MKKYGIIIFVIITSVAFASSYSEDLELLAKSRSGISPDMQATKDRLDAEAQERQAKLAEMKAEIDREAEAARKVLAAKPDAKLGMSKTQVENHSNWGKPEYKNRTITRQGVFEQWVYGEGQYLYFENGKLTAIQQ